MNINYIYVKIFFHAPYYQKMNNYPYYNSVFKHLIRMNFLHVKDLSK